MLGEDILHFLLIGCVSFADEDLLGVELVGEGGVDGDEFCLLVLVDLDGRGQLLEGLFVVSGEGEGLSEFVVLEDDVVDAGVAEGGVGVEHEINYICNEE